jgi:hypothetical protein
MESRMAVWGRGWGLGVAAETAFDATTQQFRG